jgi:hypothetical protein
MKIINVSCAFVLVLVIHFGVYSRDSNTSEVRAAGNIEGYVFNYYGLAVSDAVVGVENGPFTTSGANGYYFLEEINTGEQNLGCGKAGYNTSWILVTVLPGDTTNQNFNLTQPVMLINPLLITEQVNPGEYLTSSINILNTGTGPLNWQAEINYVSMPAIPCDYTIALYDTWGDGWTGSTLDVLVNDSIVLDNIALTSGTGPAYFSFPVFAGDLITTDFSPGTFISEPYYYIYDAGGEQVWFSPASNTGPPDILPGQLFASCSSGEWISMDYYNGEVLPFGGVNNIPTHLDASGTISGETFNADILFTSSPFVGEISIPVTMNIQGTEILIPENLVVELFDENEGQIALSWDFDGDGFQFFLLKRNGQIIATTTALSYIDILPGHGNYCYTVQSVYNEGLSAPVGPQCAEWPDPLLFLDPEALQGWVWSGFTVDVFTTVFNQGEGSLVYTFPEFAALKLLEDPNIEKNNTGNPPGIRDNGAVKGIENIMGSGYPIVLGAGGPDDFGYIWIDSDEEGGPIYGYSDISATGNPVFGLSDDNIVGPFDIGFEFYFYGIAKNNFWINSNGSIGFTSNYITIGNTTIPTNSSVYNDFIAWMWDDLVFKTGTSQVYYQVFPGKLIIQFKNYEHYGQPGLFINAEVVIYENGKILLLYDDFSPGIILNSCSVGIQASNPDVGLQVAFNTTYLHNDLALLINLPAEFIINVDPTHGIVPENSSEVITITYDSKDYEPGPYSQELLLSSNDSSNPDIWIENTMHVYLPAIFSGMITDNDNEEPLNGVQVTAGPFQATSGENGEFTLYVDEGAYDVGFAKLGYKPVKVRDTTALQDMVTPINIGMWDMNYSPGFVFAEVMDNDTLCMVTWGLPQGPYEIILDDGEGNDYFVFAHAGSWHAVKFTPEGYPATIIGGKFNVGDGSFPGPFLGSDFGVAVFDDDGVNGLPGTILDSSGVTVNNSGWVSMDWLNAEITSGSFYLAMYQSGNSPNAAPIGVDTDNPTFFRSYSRFQSSDWTLSPLQDFMIRAWISGPEGDRTALIENCTMKNPPALPSDWRRFGLTLSGSWPEILPGYERNGMASKRLENITGRDVVDYRVARYLDFNPDDPLAGGTFSDIYATDDLFFIDDNWSERPPGWHAYAVKALYTNGIYSDYTISNIVGHLMDCQASFYITLTTGMDPSDVRITMEGLDYPYETYSGYTSSNGIAVFDMVWKGYYTITIYKTGYDAYIIEETLLDNDEDFTIILSEKKYPPTGLVVDPLTLKATWDEPLRTALREEFEGSLFPPEGWQNSAYCDTTDWVRTDSAFNSEWGVPAWDSYYAFYNATVAGTASNGCCDYLITPEMDLRESNNYKLSFNSYYDGAFSQLAYIEYSTDNGANWQVIYQLSPDEDWASIEVPLANLCGPAGPEKILFAFHADDSGSMGSGWAIDNVMIQDPEPVTNYIDYSVFLDNAFLGMTGENSWDFAPLSYGQTYTASVAAHYSSGLSTKTYCTFICKYLFPPQNLNGTAPDDAAILTWDPPGNSVPTNLLGYNLYRNNIFINYLIHSGPWSTQHYVDEDLQPGIYSYTVTGVYDLSPYGLPGETGESMENGPEEVIVDYCHELEFIESWQSGNFENNKWKVDGLNWSVNMQAGIPPPVAEFSGSPYITNYDLSLESYPLCAYGMTEGNILLDYDIAMYSLNHTGNERLLVQVWGWDSQEWTTIVEYNNSNGISEWTSERVNITPQALNKIFRIRFRVLGYNSGDIRGWFLDNIHVYRLCSAPHQLMIDPTYDEGIRLTWQLADQNAAEMRSSPRGLTGCKVYRSADGQDYELLPGLAYENQFIDPEANLIFGTYYCYKVQALWQSETDQCESAFSNEACIIFTGLNENDSGLQDGFELFPNPADKYVMITANDLLKHITIYDNTGRVVFETANPGDKQFQINTGHYNSGVYLVKVETAAHSASRLLTVRR